MNCLLLRENKSWPRSAFSVKPLELEEVFATVPENYPTSACRSMVFYKLFTIHQQKLVFMLWQFPSSLKVTSL